MSDPPSFTYYRIDTVASGMPVAVVRHHRGSDDVRFEVWRRDHGEVTNHDASIVLLGEDADQISETEAHTLMGRLS